VVKTIKYFGADVKNTMTDQTIPTIPKPGDTPECGWMLQLKLMYEAG